MPPLKPRVESGFAALARGVYRHRVATVLPVARVLAGLAAQQRQTRFDASIESFFHADDRALGDSSRFRDPFGRDEVILAAINPPDVFEAALLEKLRAFPLRIGSIGLGLAVDDTIHSFHHFLRYHQQTGDPVSAVHQTLLTSGRAMLFTMLVLVTGFWLFMFATLNDRYDVGLLTGLTLRVALAADMLLSPAILALTARRAPARQAARALPARTPAEAGMQAGMKAGIEAE
jgi:predicted RND superfamily exporter protein